jgi:hypothetical protein
MKEETLVGVRGWLLFFCITLFIRGALSLLIALPVIAWAGDMRVLMGILYFILGCVCIMAGVQLSRKRKSAIRWAVASMVLSILSAVIGVCRDGGAAQYLFWSVVYTGIWWTYLVESKRVKATLKDATS